MIEFVTNNSPQSAFSIGYKANYVEDTVNKKFLVVRKITKQSARLLVIKVKKWIFEVEHVMQLGLYSISATLAHSYQFILPNFIL